MKRFFQFTGVLSVMLMLAACHAEPLILAEQLMGEWNATAIKIDGVAQPASTTMTLNLKADNTFQLNTSITSLLIPISGIWVVEESNSKIILGNDDWEIHHLTRSTLRIDNTINGQEIQVDFTNN